MVHLSWPGQDASWAAVREDHMLTNGLAPTHVTQPWGWNEPRLHAPSPACLVPPTTALTSSSVRITHLGLHYKLFSAANLRVTVGTLRLWPPEKYSLTV